MTLPQLRNALLVLLAIAMAAIIALWIGLALQRAWRSLAISVAWFVFCMTAGMLTRKYAEHAARGSHD